MGDMSAADRESFFGSLPAHEFMPLEAALRQALLDFLHARPGPFPLGEWIGRRMGGEIKNGRDENGHAEISLQGAEDMAPEGNASVEAFFEGLPVGSFSPAEEALRESIFDFLASWRSQELASLTNACANPAVQGCRRALLPKEVTLAAWIERRIGGEIELMKDTKGHHIIHLTAVARPIVTAKYNAAMKAAQKSAELPPAPPQYDPAAATAGAGGAVASSGGKGGGCKSSNSKAFFAGLPRGELSPEEAQLREAFLAWLRRVPTPSYLGDAGQDPEVQRARGALLPPNVPLREWIDRRIGGEVEVQKDASGKLEVSLRGATKERGAGGKAPAAAGGYEAFFSTLPGDQLTPEEVALREAVLGYLEAHAADPEPLMLAEACKEPDIAQRRSALLPAHVPLRMWLERRIGGEIEVIRDEGKGGYVIRSKVSAGKEGKEKFFEDLPEDRFSDNEEKMREALLAFLGRWKAENGGGGGAPPTLSHAGGDPEIRRCRAVFLPKGTPVSLKDWIERRVGGEFEMLPDANGQYLIGIRGELDPSAAHKRRPPVSGGQ
eukprot:CAMPEP_0179360302 /NCGR_PEP_ID=MMETSP0797-20121207/79905_1 /TAXON_ID=47934 /ORGANISM="Dinophysis acuminata, Strain DAEP01" /LENGTH=550 /DNA_ID=CAMNT_0021075649 /DNA_START=63 /DNA_END=1712 /DNA_ORIENTATION=+